MQPPRIHTFVSFEATVGETATGDTHSYYYKNWQLLTTTPNTFWNERKHIFPHMYGSVSQHGLVSLDGKVGKHYPQKCGFNVRVCVCVSVCLGLNSCPLSNSPHPLPLFWWRGIDGSIRYYQQTYSRFAVCQGRGTLVLKKPPQILLSNNKIC